MEKPLFQKIDCVLFYVPDLNDALAFYQDRLGLRLAWRTEQAAGLTMDDTGSEVVLHTGRKGTEIDFLVASADEAAQAFEEAGGKVIVSPFDTQIGRGVVMQDPWEHEYVLLDMSKGRLITDEHGNVVGNEAPQP